MSIADNQMATVESHEFAARVNVASDYGTFLRGIYSEGVLNNLRVFASSGEWRERLLTRVQDLADRGVDSRFENPWDVALTAYILVLNAESETLGRLAAIAAQRAPGTWWATRAIQDILEPIHSQGSPSSSSSTIPGDLVPWSAQPSSVTDTVFQASPIQNARVTRLIGMPDVSVRRGSPDAPPSPPIGTSDRRDAAGSHQTDDVEAPVE